MNSISRSFEAEIPESVHDRESDSRTNTSSTTTTYVPSDFVKQDASMSGVASSKDLDGGESTVTRYSTEGRRLRTSAPSPPDNNSTATNKSTILEEEAAHDRTSSAELGRKRRITIDQVAEQEGWTFKRARREQQFNEKLVQLDAAKAEQQALNDEMREENQDIEVGLSHIPHLHLLT